VSASIALTTVLSGFLIWGFRKVVHMFIRVTRFLDDFMGEPAREGVPARPGIMSRMQKVEEIATEVHHQVYPNGGTSMSDTVTKTAGAVADLTNRMDRWEKQGAK
jgi:hypothetical protein